ncbi:MAG TPA: nucleotide exchange factor GrpE [Ktedonobacteraceae bacterium]|nr:nucleotide exchange factor GrpE [Ktedonobacteraceae bacterium]
MQFDQRDQATVDPQSGVEDEQTDQREEELLVELKTQLVAEQAKSEEYLDMLRRTQADFINYKRRTGQEQNESRIAAQAAVLAQVLPILDDLGRALQAAPSELRDNSWVQGILLVAKRLMSVLEQLGVRQIGQPGEKFDPRWHEAVAREERADVPEGTILQVYRPGYMLGDRVIRPAQVTVAGSV